MHKWQETKESTSIYYNVCSKSLNGEQKAKHQYHHQQKQVTRERQDTSKNARRSLGDVIKKTHPSRFDAIGLNMTTNTNERRAVEGSLFVARKHAKSIRNRRIERKNLVPPPTRTCVTIGKLRDICASRSMSV